MSSTETRALKRMRKKEKKKIKKKKEASTMTNLSKPKRKKKQDGSEHEPSYVIKIVHGSQAVSICQ